MYSGVGLSSLGKGVEGVIWSELMILVESPSGLIETRSTIARTVLRAISIPPCNSFGLASGWPGVWPRASPPPTTHSKPKRATPIAFFVMSSNFRESIESVLSFERGNCVSAKLTPGGFWDNDKRQIRNDKGKWEAISTRNSAFRH